MSASPLSTHRGQLERAKQELPRYQLVSRIATGGMAEVFVALMPTSCGSAKPVVIKRLWPELAQDPDHLQMFLDEVRLTLCLHHPNVIHAYESGSDGGHPYLAMEYLDGQPFKQVLDRLRGEGGLSVPLCLKVICDVLAGLEYVHGLCDLSGKPLRIVHRDVSPQNVFLTCDGAVKLIDFGIAQSTLGQRSPRSADTKGRVAYMAPEQLRGDPTDHRADLFSVGVMLWEAVVGERLWQGMSDGEIMQRLLSKEPPPPLPRGRGFPSGLSAICARALGLDASERYASASQMQSDLAAVATGSVPAQTRLLGGLVARVFASSRALSRSMIQQSLSEGTSAPSSAGHDAKASDVDGVDPGASVSSIVTMHDEVTQVGPMRRWRTRWLPWIASAAVLCGAGLLWAWDRSRPPEPPGSLMDGPPSRPAGPRRPPSLAEPLPAVAAQAPEADVVQPASVPLEAPSSVPIPRSRPRAAKPKAVATRATAAATTRPSFFDTPVQRTAAPSSGRPIDREDPYGK